MFFIVSFIFINIFIIFYLIKKWNKYKSIILEASEKHILTDCWTSVAVIFALFMVKLTGIILFDPIIALFAAANILWTGAKLIRQSIAGLMDQANLIHHKKITEFLEAETKYKNLEFHNLRHRLSGHKILVEFHLLFHNDLKLEKAHEIACEIE